MTVGEGGKRGRTRTISMPHSQSSQYMRASSHMGTMVSGELPAISGGDTIRARRARGNSFTSTHTLNGYNSDLDAEWRIVDNPLVRSLDKRRGSSTSSASGSSTTIHSRSTTGVLSSDGAELDCTPRQHRLVVNINPVQQHSPNWDSTLPRPLHPAQQTTAAVASHYTPPRNLPRQAGGDSSPSPVGRARPHHRRALSALPTPTAVDARDFMQAGADRRPSHPGLRSESHQRLIVGSLPSPGRPTPRRSNSTNTHTSTSGRYDATVAGRVPHDAFSAGGFAFPALPIRGAPDTRTNTNRLGDRGRNVSVLSLPTLAEGEHGGDEHGSQTLFPRQGAVEQTLDGRTRRGSLSIALPQCHTRTFSTSSTHLSSGQTNDKNCAGSPKRPNGLYRATSNASTTSSSFNDSERRPMSPLSMCFMLGSSLDSDVLDPIVDNTRLVEQGGRNARSRSDRQTFSVPSPALPAAASSHPQGFLRPPMSPRGYSTGDLSSRAEKDTKKRTRTHSSTSISSTDTGDFIPGKGVVEAPSTSDVAVINMWTFADQGIDGARSSAKGDASQGQGGLRTSVSLKERLASLSRLDTVGAVSTHGGLCANLTESPAGIARAPLVVQEVQAGWRMPLTDGKAKHDAHGRGAPLIRITSLSDDYRQNANVGSRAQRPAYLSHRHTHSSPTMLHPSSAFTQQNAIRNESRHVTRKRQLSRLREPSRLGASRNGESVQRVDAVRQKLGDEELNRESMGRTSVQPGQPVRHSLATLPLRGLQGQIQERSTKKTRWWHRRNSISGVLPPQPIIRSSYMKTTRSIVDGDRDENDLQVEHATASLSSLDLASPAEPERQRLRQESPESEDFINFDDM